MASSLCILYTLLLLFVRVALAKTGLPLYGNQSEREALVRTGWWGNQIPFGNTSKQLQHCTWTGIGCNGEGRVVSIDIGTAYIGDELGKLNFSSFPYLQTLYLFQCGLSGSIPYQIGMLSKLNSLDLSNHDLRGFIPPELGLLSNLEILYLQHNRLTGTIPSALGSLTQLQYMDLSANQFSGSLDIKDANLTHLVTLDVSYNSLTGSIPIFKCNSLLYLRLSGNLLSGQIPKELGNCHSLYSLNLDNNNLTGSIPNDFRCLVNLTYLNLFENHLSDPLPISIYPYAYDEHHTCEVTSHRRKSLILHVLCIALPIIIGLFLLIVALVFFCQHIPTENQNTTQVQDGDICSVWNFDGNLAYEDIIRATNNFDIRYCIGTGGYGSVYEARLQNGKTE